MRDAQLAPPRAAATIASLRSLGYDLPTAIADLIDNSISAGASRVDVQFCFDGANSWVRTCDDGAGMNEAALERAMRLGSQSPGAERAATDHGRFGLGLKTASFSQCRRVTVCSVGPAGVATTRRWDLDVVEAHDEWWLLNGADSSAAERLLDVMTTPTGTCVLWENLDRVLPDPSAAKAHQWFDDLIARTHRHLGLVFGRLLPGPGGIRITVNGSDVEAWDPFMQRHDATLMMPEATFAVGGSRVRVRGFVLPHDSHLDGRTRDAGGGIGGWVSQQGAYVYRNRRLLAQGGWLGLGRVEQRFRLARVRVDFDSDGDAAWAIDVRKARAQVPDALKPDLRREFELVRAAALKVIRHRGTPEARTTADREDTWIWQAVTHRDGTEYRINREHPLIRAELDHGAAAADVRLLLTLLERTLPVEMIAASYTESDARAAGEARTGAGADKRLVDTLRTAIDALTRTGMSASAAAELLSAVEPWRHRPDLLLRALEAFND